MKLAVLVAFCVACSPDAKAPIPIGFTGTCKLGVHRDPSGYVYKFLNADELKTHVTLRIVRDTLVAIHVEIPDTRNSASLEELPDNPLVVGDAAPNVVIDRSGDVDVPMQLRGHGEAQSWDLSVRVRFRDTTAEVVAGKMIATGPCVEEREPASASEQK